MEKFELKKKNGSLNIKIFKNIPFRVPLSVKTTAIIFLRKIENDGNCVDCASIISIGLLNGNRTQPKNFEGFLTYSFTKSIIFLMSIVNGRIILYICILSNIIIFFLFMKKEIDMSREQGFWCWSKVVTSSPRTQIRYLERWIVLIKCSRYGYGFKNEKSSKKKFFYV